MLLHSYFLSGDELQGNYRLFIVLLLIASSATCWGAWLWLADPLTTQLPFLHSLLNHYFFTIASLFLGMSGSRYRI
jgi:hypothetical protein